jgi:hypothetical protein
LSGERHIKDITFRILSGSDYRHGEKTISFTGAGLLCHNVVENRRSYSHVGEGQTTFCVPVVPFHQEGTCFVPLVLNNGRIVQFRITVEMTSSAEDVVLQLSGTMVAPRKTLFSKAITKWPTCDTLHMWQDQSGKTPHAWAKCREYPASADSVETTISLNGYSQQDCGRQAIAFLVVYSTTKIVRLRLQINEKVDATMTLTGLYARTVALDRLVGRQTPRDGNVYVLPLGGLCEQRLENLRLVVTTKDIAREPFTVYGRISGGELPSDVTFVRVENSANKV